MIVVGPDELLNLLIIFLVVIAIPAWVTLFVKKKMPNKLWAGLALSFFFPPLGQLYLDGAVLYVLMLFIFSIVMKGLSGGANIWLIIAIISALVMLYRFKKLKNAGTKDPSTIDIKVEDA